MGVVVPAILPSSRRDIEEKLSRIVGIVDRVQIDVVDGQFATPPTWPYASGFDTFSHEVQHGEMLPHFDSFRFEIDAMVAHPETTCSTWIAAGASRITIHAESTTQLPHILDEFITRYGYDKDFAPDLLSLGLALNIESDIALIEPYLSSIDYVQFMGIAHIGRQGEPFDERVLRKIAQFRSRHPQMLIQVDGGVSLSTAPALLHAGVGRLVVGSDIWHAEDPATEILKFEELAERYGVFK